jgi:GNAT superfamily N-acetyltransferase
MELVARHDVQRRGGRTSLPGGADVTDFAMVRLQHLPPGLLAELVAESEAEGFRFLRRLVEEWAGGGNRFELPGEALFAVVSGPRVVGVCGLNVDPYACESGVGRVRRLYVLAECRRRGLGRRLLQAVVAAARGHFRLLRLRTENEAAGRFYESLGFRACAGVADCTHVLELVGHA